MILALTFAAAALVANTQATQDDMTDEDFARFLQVHDDFRDGAAEYAESAGRGCVKGATAGSFTGKGFKALCIGCAVGASSEVAAEIAFPREKKD